MAQSAYESTLKYEINKLIKYESPVDYEKTPGFIVALIDQDSSYYISFGTHVNSEQEIDRHDIFELGSVTKGIMAEILLSQDSTLDFSIYDLLNQHLHPDNQMPLFKDILIVDLLKHHTNLTKRPSGFGIKETDLTNPYQNYTLEDFKSYLNKNLKGINAQKCSYSHSNYAILELIESIDLNLTSSEFFDQMGMLNSHFEIVENLSSGINSGLDVGQPWSYSSFKYSEGLKSSAFDLQRFIKYQLSKSDSDWQIYQREKCETVYNDKYYNTLGWSVIEDIGNFDVYALTGKTNMHACFVAFVKETKTGVVILSNGVNGTKDLGMEILRTLNNNWKRKQ